jgi:hypothetical protein
MFIFAVNAMEKNIVQYCSTVAEPWVGYALKQKRIKQINFPAWNCRRIRNPVFGIY